MTNCVSRNISGKWGIRIKAPRVYKVTLTLPVASLSREKETTAEVTSFIPYHIGVQVYCGVNGYRRIYVLQVAERVSDAPSARGGDTTNREPAIVKVKTNFGGSPTRVPSLAYIVDACPGC